jgi:proliferating cell nuclear antigen
MDIMVADASLFRRSIDAIREFLPQAQLRVSQDGCRINGMDAAHVGFIDFFLSTDDCISLRIAQDCVVGMSMITLSRVLATASDTLSISCSDNADNIKIAFKTDGRSANFDLPTLDIDGDVIELPDMSYSATIKAKTADIFAVMKDIAMFGDSVSLCLNEEGFHVKSTGDLGKGELTLEPTDDRDMILEGDAVEVSFGMKHIQQIIKSCTGLAPYIEVSFDTEYPLRVKAVFGKNSYLNAYLAPKVAN